MARKTALLILGLAAISAAADEPSPSLAPPQSCDLCYLSLANGAINGSVGCGGTGCGYCTLRELSACPNLVPLNTGTCIGTCSGGSRLAGPTGESPLPATGAPPSEAATPPPANGGSSTCRVRYQQSSAWSEGQGRTATAVNLYLQNTGSAVTNIPYTVAVASPGVLATLGNWNWAVGSAGSGQISGRVDAASWENLAPLQGNEVNIGFVVVLANEQATAFAPSQIAVAGQPCVLAT